MFPLIAGLLLLSGLHPTPQDVAIPPDARATIAAANAEWLPALKVGDAAKIAAPYADDGIFITANGVSVKGREAVAQLMRDRSAQMGKVLGGELVQDGMTRQGSVIYEWGHATVQLLREGAAPARSSGRYLTVWRQGPAGRWEIVRNLSLPD